MESCALCVTYVVQRASNLLNRAVPNYLSIVSKDLSERLPLIVEHYSMSRQTLGDESDMTATDAYTVFQLFAEMLSNYDRAHFTLYVEHSRCNRTLHILITTADAHTKIEIAMPFSRIERHWCPAEVEPKAPLMQFEALVQD